MTQSQKQPKQLPRLKVRQFAFSDLTSPQKRWLMEQKDYSGTIVVRPDSAVTEVMQARANLVVVVGDSQDVEGVLIPDDLTKQVQKKYHIVGGDLNEVLNELSTNHPELEHYERIVFERPRLYWCAQGQHWTSSIPCTQKHQ